MQIRFQIRKIIKLGIEIKIIKNLHSFPLNFSDLNLKFSSFKFETNRILETITIKIKTL